MNRYQWMNGRLLQQQPCQQQQGGFMRQQPPPPGYPGTLIGGHGAPELSPDIALDPSVAVPPSDDRVVTWIRRAVGQTDVDPYTYLNNARKQKLDEFDDNLPAAERYFEGLQGNYGAAQIAGLGVVKALREIQIGEFKPMESVLGRNGSKASGLAIRRGLAGVADRNEKRSAQDRVRIGHPH